MAPETAAGGGRLRAGAAAALALAALAGCVQRYLDDVQGDYAPYRCALTSFTWAVGNGDTCARTFPVKWEDQLYSTLLSLAAWTCVVAAGAALHAWAVPPPATKTAATAAAAAAPRSTAALALHAGWLVVHGVIDTALRPRFGAKWLCTWSWMASAVHAACALLTARDANWPRAFPLTAFEYPVAVGLIVWTHLSYLHATHADAVNVVLHLLPLAYFAAAAAVDEAHRPPLPLRTALRTIAAVGLGPIVVVDLYAQLFDYRDLYAKFFEQQGITSWWPSLEMALMAATAMVVAHALYGLGGPAVQPRRRRWALLAAVAAAAAAAPLSVVVLRPVRMHHLRNCPPGLQPLATWDAARGALRWHNATAAALLEGAMNLIYVHAVMGPHTPGRDAAQAPLEAVMLDPMLVDLCPPLALPPAGTVGVHVWAVPLPQTWDVFRMKVIGTPDMFKARLGTLLVLYVDGLDTTGSSTASVAPAAAAAATATLAAARSIIYHVPDVPTAAEAATLAGLLHGAAALHARAAAACGLGRVLPGPLGGAAGAEAPALGDVIVAADTVHGVRPAPAGTTYRSHRHTADLVAALGYEAYVNASHQCRTLELFELGAHASLSALTAADWRARVQAGLALALGDFFPVLARQFAAVLAPYQGDDPLRDFLAAYECTLRLASAA